MSMLSDSSRQFLLETARQAACAAARGERFSPPDHPPPETLAPHGAFVTLHVRGELRGCIGTFDDSRPLLETVADMARSAATRDPRFDPLSPDEFGGLGVEISVLSPRQAIHSIGEITVGRDGLMVEWMGWRGVLLPQVAAEYNWTPHEFLEATCRKAGFRLEDLRGRLPHMEIFQAEIFHDAAFTG
ncbi:MAG: hypothetical protein GMKNLPBB_02807 [Myxococcota bacterium]|nr:hypothetical protein [Myxococcota bacterium]